MKVCHNYNSGHPFVDGYVGHIKAKLQDGTNKRYVYLSHPSQTYGFCIDEPDAIEYSGNEFSYKSSSCYGLWETPKECKDSFKVYAEKFKGMMEMELTSIEPLSSRVITIHQTYGTMIKP